MNGNDQQLDPWKGAVVFLPGCEVVIRQEAPPDAGALKLVRERPSEIPAHKLRIEDERLRPATNELFGDGRLPYPALEAGESDNHGSIVLGV